MKALQLYLAFVLLIAHTQFVTGFTQTGGAGGHNLPSMPIDNLELEASNIHLLLSELSNQKKIPIGVEVSPHDHLLRKNHTLTDRAWNVGGRSSSEEQLSNHYRVELSEGTIADFMGQIINQNGRYDWLIENGVVNIFPRDKYRNSFLAELLAVRISNFAVDKNSDCWKLQNDLVNTPEIKAVIEANGMQIGTNFSGFYFPQVGKNFSLKVSDITLKGLLNRVIRESPLARTWIISTDNSSRTLSLGVTSRPQENSH